MYEVISLTSSKNTKNTPIETPLYCDNDSEAIQATLKMLTYLVNSPTYQAMPYMKGIKTTFKAVHNNNRIVCNMTI